MRNAVTTEGITLCLGGVKLSACECKLEILSCTRTKLWLKALLLLEAMARANIQQDTISRNATISACRKCWQWQEALILFEGMGNGKMRQDTVSYNAAISAFEKGARWRGGLLLLESMVKAQNEHSIISYSAAIRCLCQEWPMAASIAFV